MKKAKEEKSKKRKMFRLWKKAKKMFKKLQGWKRKENIVNK